MKIGRLGVLSILIMMLLLVSGVNAQEVTPAAPATATVIAGAETSLVPAPTLVAEPTLPAPVNTVDSVLNSPFAILFTVFGGVALIAFLIIVYLLVSQFVDRLHNSNPAEAGRIGTAAELAGKNLYDQFKKRAQDSPETWDDFIALVSGPIVEQILKRLGQPTTTSENMPVPNIPIPAGWTYLPYSTASRPGGYAGWYEMDGKAVAFLGNDGRVLTIVQLESTTSPTSTAYNPYGTTGLTTGGLET